MAPPKFRPLAMTTTTPIIPGKSQSAVDVYSRFGCYPFFWCSFSRALAFHAQICRRWLVFCGLRNVSVRMLPVFLVLLSSRPCVPSTGVQPHAGILRFNYFLSSDVTSLSGALSLGPAFYAHAFSRCLCTRIQPLAGILQCTYFLNSDDTLFLSLCFAFLAPVHYPQHLFGSYSTVLTLTRDVLALFTWCGLVYSLFCWTLS